MVCSLGVAVIDCTSAVTCFRYTSPPLCGDRARQHAGHVPVIGWDDEGCRRPAAARRCNGDVAGVDVGAQRTKNQHHHHQHPVSTGFQSTVELTSNWHALSFRLCLVVHLRTCLTTYVWSRKGLDVTCARLPTDRVLFHAHTTHSVTEVLLSRGRVSGIAFQDTYATRISPTAASGVNSKLRVINIRTN